MTSMRVIALSTLVAEHVSIWAYLARRPLMTSSASVRYAPCICTSMLFAAFIQCT